MSSREAQEVQEKSVIMTAVAGDITVNVVAITYVGKCNLYQNTLAF